MGGSRYAAHVSSCRIVSDIRHGLVNPVSGERRIGVGTCVADAHGGGHRFRSDERT